MRAGGVAGAKYSGFYQVQRDDSGAVRLGVDKIRVYHAEKAVVFPR